MVGTQKRSEDLSAGSPVRESHGGPTAHGAPHTTLHVGTAVCACVRWFSSGRPCRCPGLLALRPPSVHAGPGGRALGEGLI